MLIFLPISLFSITKICRLIEVTPIQKNPASSSKKYRMIFDFSSTTAYERSTIKTINAQMETIPQSK
jgi:hypothetical protein